MLNERLKVGARPAAHIGHSDQISDYGYGSSACGDYRRRVLERDSSDRHDRHGTGHARHRGHELEADGPVTGVLRARRENGTDRDIGDRFS
jgi:hypothetical protein